MMKKSILLSFVLVAILAMAQFTQSWAADETVPRVLNYQASLLDENNEPIADGGTPVTFRIYEDEFGGSPIWVEIQDVNSVDGFVNVYLGTQNPINFTFNRPYWLEVTVGNGTPFPRTRLTANPYAMYAIDADTARVAMDVVDGAITQEKLAPGVQAIPIGPAGGVLTGEYPNPGIDPQAIIDNIEAGSITQEHLAPNVTTPPSGPAAGDLTGTYPDPLIAVGAVKTDRIFDGAVTTVKIANGAVTNIKIGPDAVTTDKIMNGTILTEDIADMQITTPKIADLAVTNEKIGPDAVTTDKIMDGTILTADIADRQVTTEKIAEEAVTPFELQATTVMAGDYGDEYNVGTFTVDEDGRLTFAEDVLIQAEDDMTNSDIEVVGTDIDALDLQLYPDVAGVREIYASTEEGETVDKPGMGYVGTFMYYNYKVDTPNELTWSKPACRPVLTGMGCCNRRILLGRSHGFNTSPDHRSR